MTPKGFCKKYQTNGFVSPILANPTTLSLSMDHICIFIFQSAWTFLGHFIYSLKSGSYFSLCLIFLPKNTHKKNVFSVKRSRRKKDNHAAFHISYKNISKKAVDLSLYITSLFGNVSKGAINILLSSAQAPAEPSWAEFALFLQSPTTHPPPPTRESLFSSSSYLS